MFFSTVSTAGFGSVIKARNNSLAFWFCGDAYHQ
jgi:hypothetical protein